jgi:hypothetical protein
MAAQTGRFAEPARVSWRRTVAIGAGGGRRQECCQACPAQGGQGTITRPM